MKIVTVGEDFTDIDAFAGCVAYAELLRQNGEKAAAVLPGQFNSSITPYARSLEVPYATTYTPNDDDTFTLIDIAHPEFFAKFVDEARIDEIIDHHPGFDEYWTERRVKHQIEHIGAACTLVVERWQQTGKLNALPRPMAELLAFGILDNTLNLKARITAERDHSAYLSLGISERLREQYFRDCQRVIEQNIADALQSDMKSIQYPGTAEPYTVGQLALWDTAAVIASDEYQQFIKQHAYINLIDIRAGVSYFLSRRDDVKQFLSGVLGVVFDGDIAQADRLWLRKEIMKAAIDAEKDK